MESGLSLSLSLHSVISKGILFWDANDVKMAQLNAKAMHTFFCAVGVSEYDRESEKWDKLEWTHEGTNQVKESKDECPLLTMSCFK